MKRGREKKERRDEHAVSYRVKREKGGGERANGHQSNDAWNERRNKLGKKRIVRSQKGRGETGRYSSFYPGREESISLMKRTGGGEHKVEGVEGEYGEKKEKEGKGILLCL